MRGLETVERPLRRLPFRAVRRQLDDLLPRGLGARQILLAERTHDTDVQQCLRVFGIDLAATCRTAPARGRPGSCSSS